MLIYQGPSKFDGRPIIVIVTGYDRASTNSKTGKLAQVWILRSDVKPSEALRRNADISICWHCKHRGVRGKKRTCYVNMRAPNSIYACYKRGKYPVVSPQEAGRLLTDKKVRIGSYGDPAAVPIEVWNELLASVQSSTGYTHDWREERSQGLKRYCMASADSKEEALQALRAGWRPFRVTAPGETIFPKWEKRCPASAEAGHATTCEFCMACGGDSGPAVNGRVLEVHGSGKAHFQSAA